MNVNTNTWLSWLTTGVGLAAGAALDRGYIDANTATALGGAGAALVPLLWGLFVHRDARVVQTASLVQGVAKDSNGAAIKILPDAPPALLALATDRSVPTVKPEFPAPSPYATQRRV